MMYGANEAMASGLESVLAGRRAGLIQKLAAELGPPAQIFDLSAGASSTAALATPRCMSGVPRTANR
jgi:short subunit dehydrogenase-like uncharacterized protein